MAKLILSLLLGVFSCFHLSIAIGSHNSPSSHIGRSASSVPHLQRRSLDDDDNAPALNIHRQVGTSLGRLPLSRSDPSFGFTVEGKPPGQSKRIRVHLEPLRDSPRVSLLRALCRGRSDLERGTRHVLLARRRRLPAEARLYVGKIVWRQPQRSHRVVTRPASQPVLVRHAGGQVDLGASRLAPRATRGPDPDAVLGGSILEGSASSLNPSTALDTGSSLASEPRPRFSFRDLTRASWWRDQLGLGPGTGSDLSDGSTAASYTPRAPQRRLSRAWSRPGGGLEGTGDQDFVGAFYDFRRDRRYGPHVAVSSERLARQKGWKLEYRGQVPDGRLLAPIMEEVGRRPEMNRQRWVKEVEQALLHDGPVRHRRR